MHRCYICGKEMENGYTVENCIEICDSCHAEQKPLIDKGYFSAGYLTDEMRYEKNLEKFLSVYA